MVTGLCKSREFYFRKRQDGEKHLMDLNQNRRSLIFINANATQNITGCVYRNGAISRIKSQYYYI